MIVPWQKPLRGAQINPAHPLARGLRRGVLFNAFTGTKVYGLNGETYSPYSSDYAYWHGDGYFLDGVDLARLAGDSLLGSQLGQSPEGSVVAVFDLLGLTNPAGDALQHILYNPVSLTLNNDGSIDLVRNTSSSYCQFQSVAGVVSPGRNVLVGAFSLGRDVYISVNGIEPPTDFIFTGGGTLTDRSGGYPYIGGSGNVWLGNAYARYHMVLWYDRFLTRDEARAISANPYCMFRQPTDLGAFGYVDTGGGGTTYTQSLTGELPYPSGSLLYSVAFSAPLTGDLPSPAGGVAKHISKPLAGDFPSVFGEAVKQTNKQLSGIPPSPSGSVVKHTDKHLLGDIPSGDGVIIPSSDITQSVYGELPSPSGGAIKHTAKQLSGASPSPTGDSTKHISTTLRGEAPAPSGTPNQAYRTSQSTSGIMGLIFGAISSILNPIVSLRSAAGIIGSRLKRFIGG